MECLGVAGLHNLDDTFPELGLWLEENAHDHGYGLEAVTALAEWATRTMGTSGFAYPAAVQNLPSRRIAEQLDGEDIKERKDLKYDSVVYRIPASKP